MKIIIEVSAVELLKMNLNDSELKSSFDWAIDKITGPDGDYLDIQDCSIEVKVA